MESPEKLSSPSERLKRSVAMLAGTVLFLGGCADSSAEEYAAAEAHVISVDKTPALPALEKTVNLDILQIDWREIMQSREGKVDIAVLDLASGESVRYQNTHERFYTASIIKLPILIEQLRQYQEAGVPAHACRDATSACANIQLARPMITESDNSTAQQLFVSLGDAPALQSFHDKIGAKDTSVSYSWGVTQTTAPDQIKVLQTVASPGALLSSDYADVALELMDDVVPHQRWGVSGGVPEGSYQLKNGWMPATDCSINSIGYVHNDDAQYLIAILTKNSPSMDYAEETMRQLSTVTYESIAHPSR